jgi:prepilin-type N-terminal cleavage/methylation domain-containing protein
MSRRFIGQRGFSLLEVMVALAILLVASVSAVIGLTAASGDLRKGQFWTHQMTLVESSMQRIQLQDKNALLTAVQNFSPPLSCARNSLTSQPAATCGWQMDGTNGVDAGLDLSVGALFRILPDGTITHVDATGFSDCAAAGLPADVYCREIVMAIGGPSGDGDAGMVGGTTRAGTVWVRVKRKSDSDRQFVALREVIAL